jgi:uncharacterized protein
MELPNDHDIELLHKKYTPTQAAFNAVFTHCTIVWQIAAQLLEAKPQPQLNRELVRVGCLLHDIGVYRFEQIGGGLDIGANYIQHGQFSYEALKTEGFPEVICRFGSHHTGVGLTKQAITSNNLPLPHEDFLAETAEERLVMYADKFHSKSTPPRLNSYDKYRAYAARFTAGNDLIFDSFAVEFGRPNLAPLAAQFGQPIV